MMVDVNPDDEATGFCASDGTHTYVCRGLTKREWLAGLALQGLLVGDVDGGYASSFPSGVAIDAVKCADALLAELAKPQQKEPEA